MNNKRLLNALNLKENDHRPIWIMRQAGRYLPEYRKVREKYSFREVSETPELAAEVTLQPLKRFEFDASIIFADIITPLKAMNINFDFNPGPIIENPISTPKQIDALPDKFYEVAPEVQASLKLVKSELKSQQTLIGFGGAPWTLAAYLIQGKGQKDFPAIRRFASEYPESLQSLLTKLSDLSIQYFKEQFESGAEVIQIFDSWAGLLSIKDWQTWIQPHLLHIVSTLKASNIPVILFLQNANHLVEYYCELPISGIGVDWRVDLSKLQSNVKDHIAVQGNLDPAILLAGPEVTKKYAINLLNSIDPKGHIMNLGHGILPNTPIESVHALIEVIKNER